MTDRHPRLKVSPVLAEFGVELQRHALIASLAFVLAMPVRHVNEVLHQLTHAAARPLPVAAQHWPRCGMAPAELLR